jgi:hypothetical protein
MSDPKTQPTDASVDTYISGIADEGQRADSRKLLDVMREATGQEPVMWGAAIVGFGRQRYTYANGKEGEWMVVGFSARKTALTLYGLHHYAHHQQEVQALGRVKLGKGCLYVKRLADVDEGKLKALVQKSYHEHWLENYQR